MNNAANRDRFLQRVRAATLAGRAYRVHKRDIPQGIGYVGAAGDPCHALAKEVEEVGGVSVIAEDLPEARQALESLLRAYAPRSALCWEHPLLNDLGLHEILRAQSVAVHQYQTLLKTDVQQQRRELLAADIGITSADWAIAETGTLVMVARPGQERLASLLPPVHIAVVGRSQIVPDLFDAIEKLRSLGFDGLPSNVTLITGPSKTGDIELQLTTGVHGPGKWHVIIVRSG